MADLGRNVKYGLGKETTPGTAAAASVWINQLSSDFIDKGEVVSNNSAFGVLERTNSSNVLRNWSEGKLEAKLTADNAGYILLGAFGSVSSADNPDTNPIVKDHTFTINQNIAGQSFTLWRKDSIASVQYPLTRFGEWKLTMDLKDYVKYSADIMARKGVTASSTPAYTDEIEFLPKHISLKTASSAAGLSGATAIGGVESFTLTVNPNLEADWEAGNASPANFTSRGYEMSFEMTARYTDQTYENAYKNGTTLAFSVTATNTDVIIGAAANPKLAVTAPKINLTDWSRDESLDGPLMQTFTGTIHYSVADAYALRAVLTNSTSSY